MKAYKMWILYKRVSSGFYTEIHAEDFLHAMLIAHKYVEHFGAVTVKSVKVEEI